MPRLKRTVFHQPRPFMDVQCRLLAHQPKQQQQFIKFTNEEALAKLLLPMTDRGKQWSQWTAGVGQHAVVDVAPASIDE